VAKDGARGVQRFEARLENDHSGLGWVVVRVPFVPSEVWKGMVRLRVKGSVNGSAFRTSLFPLPGGDGFMVLVNKAMQAGGKVRLGQMAEFVLEPDLQERPAELPDELAVLLDEVEGLRALYDELTEYTRREIGKWIGGVKSDAARMKRVEQMAERLMSVMEAEVELPPLIARAFRARPRARAGWEKMTPLQRRHELMAVFSYQSPESREKRLAKTLELAEGKA
jgi:uncharacterized protein YdeI (YjbR/CyaY-like superfamily)